MTTKGLLLAGTTGVALLAAVGVWTVLRAEGDGGRAGASAQPIVAPPPDVPPPEPAPPPAATAQAAPPAASEPPAEPPRAALPAGVPELQRALEPLRREVFAGLADLDGRIEACRLLDAGLTLTLETLDRSVRILEVQVAPAGASTQEATGVAPAPLDDRAVACVRGALERTVLEAPSAVKGRRWQMDYAPGTKP